MDRLKMYLGRIAETTEEAYKIAKEAEKATQAARIVATEEVLPVEETGNRAARRAARKASRKKASVPAAAPTPTTSGKTPIEPVESPSAKSSGAFGYIKNASLSKKIAAGGIIGVPAIGYGVYRYSNSHQSQG